MGMATTFCEDERELKFCGDGSENGRGRVEMDHTKFTNRSISQDP